LCIVVGVLLGQLLPGLVQAIGRMEVARVNLPVGLLIWAMIHWAVKPFSMALFGWIFVRHVFALCLPADQLDSDVAGLILLAAAPCTAMVFVWSRLTNGHPLFTLSQVALNDALMVFAFAPIVALLLGLSATTVPWDTLLASVVLYIVVPLGADRRQQFLRAGGGRGDQPVRLPVGCGAGHRGGRADRRAGDAAGGARRQPHQALVRGRGRFTSLMWRGALAAPPTAAPAPARCSATPPR